jgi:IS30 family transposase
VSHETIYRSLFIQARGVLKKELLQYLRTQRPASVEDRAVPGHWEGDLIAGSKNSYIATLVERHTRYVMLPKVKNKDTDSVINALIKQSKKLPNELYQSLTWDRGKE